MLQFLGTNGLAVLGWSLLNGIWQMGLLWLLYLLLTGNHKRFSAAVRHNLAGILALLGTCWFLYSLISSLVFPADTIDRIPLFFLNANIAGYIDPFLSALSMLYLLVLVFQIFRYTLGFCQLRRKRKHNRQLFSLPLQSFADRISAVMGIPKRVNILLADWVDTAQTIGFIKPMILLPVALVNRLSMEQVETILLHELQHIRRNDYFFNILMTVFRTLFFFNPFAGLFFKTVAREREHACDDEVLLWNYPAPVYAEALLTLEKFRQHPQALSLAADGNNPRLLMERIRRLAGLPASGKRNVSPLLSFSLVAALFIFAMNSFSHFRQADGNNYSPHLVKFQNNTAFVPALAAKKTTGMVVLQKIRIVVRAKPDAGKNETVRKIKTPLSPPEVKNPEYRVLMVALPQLQAEMDEAGANVRLQYADQTEVRNFSNEKAVQAEIPATINLEGIPYIPSGSFTVSPVADTLITDVLLRNKMLALLSLGKVKAEELKAKIHSEIDLQQKALRQLEKENLQLIKQKTLQPAAQKLRLDVQKRKDAIRMLMQQVQVLNGEIIII